MGWVGLGGLIFLLLYNVVNISVVNFNKASSLLNNILLLEVMEKSGHNVWCSVCKEFL